MHAAAYDFVNRSSANLPAGPVLEIGSLDINGSIRGLFGGRPYLGIDVVPGPSVDLLADGATYQPEILHAIVVCCEVLEHTPHGEAICRNAARALQPGGVFVLTAAGIGRPPHSAVDGGPLRAGEFYCNVTADELEAWLSDFTEVAIETNPRAGDIYAIARKAAR